MQSFDRRCVLGDDVIMTLSCVIYCQHKHVSFKVVYLQSSKSGKVQTWSVGREVSDIEKNHMMSQ